MVWCGDLLLVSAEVHCLLPAVDNIMVSPNEISVYCYICHPETRFRIAYSLQLKIINSSGFTVHNNIHPYSPHWKNENAHVKAAKQLLSLCRGVIINGSNYLEVLIALLHRVNIGVVS